MNQVKIYLADLTYTTLSLATEAFPLNIGYVAAYCQKCFGDQAELTLFKYPNDLEHAIYQSPPDILALSNYPWNHSLGLEFFQIMHTIRPETLCVMGGSNIPHQPELQAEFMKTRQIIDIYVYLEGEVGFSNIVGRILENGALGLERSWLKKEPLGGCLFVSPEGRFVAGTTIPRARALDEFPSPYLTGLLDKFFDGQLSPMIETNRGCPFSCTFCHEGHAIFQKVNFFGMDRVKAELEYIAQRVPPSVHNLMFCDPNFGMYQRDVEICETMAAIQARTGWPQDIFATTGKNNKDRIGRSLSQLGGAMQMWLSVQSMDEVVLDNIKRTNIKLQDMMDIQASLTANHLPSKSEIILGLPGETYESHIRSIADLVTAGVDTITAYTLMLLNGTDMNTPEERKKWGFVTKFRVLPRDFGRLGNGKNVVEVEEVVVATKDLSFDAYVALRRLHLLISVIYNGKPFAALFKLFRQLDIDVFPLLEEMVERETEAPSSVRELLAQFERETVAELWDSEEEIRAFFRHDENYDRLISGELGGNLLQKYVALSLIEASEQWASYTFMIAEDVVFRDRNDRGSPIQGQLDNVRRYSGARVRNVFGVDRLSEVPEAVLDYDVEAWMADVNDRPLEDFRYEEPTTVKFVFTQEQNRTTEDYIARFGSSHQGVGKILTKMNIINAWRKCTRAGDVEELQVPGQPKTYYALIDEQASGGIIAKR